MAQTALHGIIGLGLVRKKALAGAAVFGLVLGSILPDVDLLGVVAVFPFDAHIATQHIHRTFTHSLITIVLITLILVFAARSARGRAVALGVGVGMLAHVAVDVLIWFSGVDLLWPLGLWGLPSSVNLWVGYQPSLLIGRLLAAVEPGLFGLFVHYLLGMAKRSGTCLDFLAKLNSLRRALFAVSGLYIGLAFALPDMVFQIAYYGVYAVFVLPIGFYVTIRLRETVEG